MRTARTDDMVASRRAAVRLWRKGELTIDAAATLANVSRSTAWEWARAEGVDVGQAIENAYRRRWDREFSAALKMVSKENQMPTIRGVANGRPRRKDQLSHDPAPVTLIRPCRCGYENRVQISYAAAKSRAEPKVRCEGCGEWVV